MSVQEYIRHLTDAGRYPKRAIAEAMQKTGKAAIGCFPIYLPEEIIYASGLLPVGLWGGQSDMTDVDRYIQSFGCTIMRVNMELAMRGQYDFLKAIVMPTYCDTMKSIQANWSAAVKGSRVLPYTVLQNRMGSGSLDFILGQNETLKKGLEEVSGKKITEKEIDNAFQIYEACRAAMREFTDLVNEYPVTLNPTVRHLILKASWFFDKKDYCEELTLLMNELRQQPKEKLEGPRVVLTGLVLEPVELADLLTEYHYTVAADDLAHESRQFRTLARKDGTTMEKIAYRMIDLKGDTFFFDPQKERGQILIDTVRHNHADGVVVCMYKFCDPEEFDYPVCKKQLEDAEIPILYIETDHMMRGTEQLRTRIQSFAEIYTL